MQVGRYVGRQASSPSNHFILSGSVRPIISFSLNEMIGLAYYSPTTAGNLPDFFLLFVRAFDLLIAVRMKKRILTNITKSASKIHYLPKL